MFRGAHAAGLGFCTNDPNVAPPLDSDDDDSCPRTALGNKNRTIPPTNMTFFTQLSLK
jgi:hypothetical protein